mmetsp:Transcript_4922/g.8654  ORF Transcript_4922/g.8654 Transcript_4922/m.8654 type:complete len:112 (-) Transcript_4922:95-430(-)
MVVFVVVYLMEMKAQYPPESPMKEAAWREIVPTFQSWDEDRPGVFVPWTTAIVAVPNQPMVLGDDVFDEEVEMIAYCLERIIAQAPTKSLIIMNQSMQYQPLDRNYDPEQH